MVNQANMSLLIITDHDRSNVRLSRNKHLTWLLQHFISEQISRLQFSFSCVKLWPALSTDSMEMKRNEIPIYVIS